MPLFPKRLDTFDLFFVKPGHKYCLFFMYPHQAGGNTIRRRGNAARRPSIKAMARGWCNCAAYKPPLVNAASCPYAFADGLVVMLRGLPP